MKRQGFAIAGLAGLVPSSGLAAPSIIGLPYIALRTADSAARTNNTLANDDAAGGTLQFPITASATALYFVEAFVKFNGANTTMDLKVGWNATALPTGATAEWGALSEGIPAAAISGYGQVGTGTTPVTFQAIGGTMSFGTSVGTTIGVALAGTFLGGGTAGNIVFAWAQNTTDAGALVLKATSFLRVTLLRA